MSDFDAWLRGLLAGEAGPMWVFVFGLIMFWLGQLTAPRAPDRHPKGEDRNGLRERSE